MPILHEGVVSIIFSNNYDNVPSRIRDSCSLIAIAVTEWEDIHA